MTVNQFAASVYELMQLHVAALYKHDTHGRLVAVNQWDGGIVPRLFLGRTVEGNLWRFGVDLPHDLIAALSELCQDEPPYDGSRDGSSWAPRHRDQYLKLLSEHAAVEREWSGPAYLLPGREHATSDAVAITEQNANLLRNGFDDWLDDVPHRQPFLAVVEDGRAVSICASVRITENAYEAGVETLADFRGRGLAVKAITAWTRAVRDRGALPLYSTSWENTASQRVAAKLRGQRYGVDFHIT